MALVPYTITALAESDAQGTDGKNIVAGATCSMYSQPSDSVVTLYDDAAGSNGSTAKLTGANGQVVVYVEQGRYRVNVNASDSFVTVSSDVPIDVDTFANLAASSPVQDGQRFICQERANANYILKPSGYTALAGDVTFANGRVGALIGGSNNTSITVNVPSDFSTIQAAIDFYYNKVLFSSGVVVTINIESGHQPSTGVSVSNGDYSKFTITSDDAEVTVSPSWFGGGFIVCENGRSPILDTIVNLNGLASSSGYYLNNSSLGFIKTGAGMRNGNNRGIHASNSSSLAADGCVFTGFSQAGAHASRNSRIQCADADFSGNSQDSGSNFGAVYASRGSVIHGPNIDASSSGGDGVRAQRLASIIVPDINLSNCTRIAFVANGAFILSDSGSPTLTNLAGQLIVASGGGQIKIGESNATFQPGMTDNAIDSRDSRVVADEVGLSGHEGIGVFSEGAGALVDISAANITGGTYGIWAAFGSTINARLATVTGATSVGVRSSGGSRVVIEDGSVTGSSSDDLNISSGGWINADSCTTTNGAGNPDVLDTNLTGGFNFANNGDRGFIWA